MLYIGLTVSFPECCPVNMWAFVVYQFYFSVFFFLLPCPGRIQQYVASGWCWGWLHLFMVSGSENPVKLNPLKRKLMMLSGTEYNGTGCISAHWLIFRLSLLESFNKGHLASFDVISGSRLHLDTSSSDLFSSFAALKTKYGHPDLHLWG